VDKFLDGYCKNLSAYINGVYVAKTCGDCTFLNKIKYFLEKTDSMFNFNQNHKLTDILKNVTTSINTFCISHITDPKTDFENIIEYGGKLMDNGHNDDETKQLMLNRLKNISHVKPFMEYFSSVTEYTSTATWKTTVSTYEGLLISGINKIIDRFNLSKEEKLEFVENIMNDVYSSYYSSHLTNVMKKGNKLSFPLSDKFCYLDALVIRSTNKFYISYKQICGKCIIAMLNSDASRHPATIDPMNIGLETYFVNALLDVYPNDVISKNDLIDVFFTKKDQGVISSTTKNESFVKNARAKKAKITNDPVIALNEFVDEHFDLSKIDRSLNVKDRYAIMKADFNKLIKCEASIGTRKSEYIQLLSKLHDIIVNQNSDDDEGTMSDADSDINHDSDEGTLSEDLDRDLEDVCRM
jgi:hypothetical protein